MLRFFIADNYNNLGNLLFAREKALCLILGAVRGRLDQPDRLGNREGFVGPEIGSSRGHGRVTAIDANKRQY